MDFFHCSTRTKQIDWFDWFLIVLIDFCDSNWSKLIISHSRLCKNIVPCLLLDWQPKSQACGPIPVKLQMNKTVGTNSWHQKKHKAKHFHILDTKENEHTCFHCQFINVLVCSDKLWTCRIEKMTWQDFVVTKHVMVS